MKLIPKNITLENVKKSNYWKLISILVWNHYAEKEQQDESKVTFKESWRGIGDGIISANSKWDSPDYSEPGLTRTLGSIVITFERSDYITYIYIKTDGNVGCFGAYVDKNKTTSPTYWGIQRSLDITNWMLENDFLTIE